MCKKPDAATFLSTWEEDSLMQVGLKIYVITFFLDAVLLQNSCLFNTIFCKISVQIWLTFRRLLSTTVRSPYQVLDIPSSATKADIKKAYIEKAKKVSLGKLINFTLSDIEIMVIRLLLGTFDWYGTNKVLPNNCRP